MTRLNIALSMDEFTDDLLDRLSRKSGLPRSVIVRRLIVAYGSGVSNTVVLPPVFDAKAKTMVSEFTRG